MTSLRAIAARHGTVTTPYAAQGKPDGPPSRPEATRGRPAVLRIAAQPPYASSVPRPRRRDELAVSPVTAASTGTAMAQRLALRANVTRKPAIKPYTDAVLRVSAYRYYDT